MGAMIIRRQVCRDVNDRFGKKKIARTAKELEGLVAAGGDFFDLLHKYDILRDELKGYSVGGNFARYKEVQRMPHLHKVLLTEAFRAAVLNKPRPLPIEFDIASGDVEAIEVKTTSRSITIKLTRVDKPARKKSR